MLNNIIENKNKIHTRELKLATYPHTDGRVVVHGILLDKRYIPIFDVTGAVKQPGIIHHIDVKLMVAPDPLRIEIAEADMIHVSLDDCKKTLDTVEQLNGIEVRSGFSGKVRKIMGGKKGCTHLCHLVTVMGQEIVHGWLTRKGIKKSPLPENIESISESGFLIDSCRMWMKDGPKMNNLIDAIKRRI